MVQYITHTTNHLNTVLCINNNPEKCPFLVPVLLSVCETCGQLHQSQCHFSSLSLHQNPRWGSASRAPRARHESASAVLFKDAAHHVLSLRVWKQSSIFWDSFKGGNNVVQNQEPAWRNKHEAGKKQTKCRETIT